jgi:hypothetical protein
MPEKSKLTTCLTKINIADSLDVIVEIERRPGKRFVSQVLEIRGYAPT